MNTTSVSIEISEPVDRNRDPVLYRRSEGILADGRFSSGWLHYPTINFCVRSLAGLESLIADLEDLRDLMRSEKCGAVQNVRPDDGPPVQTVCELPGGHAGDHAPAGDAAEVPA